MQTQEAPFFDLGKKDFIKAAITAGIIGGLSVIAPALSAGTLITAAVLKAAGYGALSGFVGYLLKNLMTNSKDEFMKPEPGTKNNSALPCIAVLLCSTIALSSCGTTQQTAASMNVRYIMTSADGGFKVGLTFNVKNVTPAYLDSLINAKTQNIFDVEKLYSDSLGSHADAVVTIPPLK